MKSGLIEGPAFFSRSEPFESFSNNSDWLEKSRPLKKHFCFRDVNRIMVIYDKAHFNSHTVFEMHITSVLSYNFFAQFAVCTFICQVTSTRRQRSDLCGLRFKLPPVTTSLTT